MITVLDTNVVSELMREAPRGEVLAWVDARPWHELFVTAVTEAEVRTGVAILPAGKRRLGLMQTANRIFADIFAQRVLPFDGAAASAYAEITAGRRAIGRPISQLDCQIAAIARCRGAALATRNVRDFEETGIEVLDPWAEV